MSEYYDSTGAPANNSAGNSATIRAEFDAIEDAFDKLPPLAGNADEAVFVNGAGTALTSVPAATARAYIGAEASANKDVSGGFAGLTAFKINMMNVLNTFMSFLTNSNTAARTYTFPDDDGTIALTSDMPESGRRNTLINGDFDIWQRNDTDTTNGYTTADRWYLNSNGSTFTNTRQSFVVGQTSVPDNPEFFFQEDVTTVAGAGNFKRFSQRIEGVRTHQSENVTLSFYAVADAIKNISVEFLQHFGTGGAPSADVTTIGVNKIALTNAWAKYSITVAIPSITGKTIGTNGDDYLEVIFWLDAGTDFDTRTNTLGQQSGIYGFSHIQLETGSTSTTFDTMSVDRVTELCHRYYVGDIAGGNEGRLEFSGNVTIAATYTAYASFPATMRAVPSITLSNQGNLGFAAATGATTVYTHGVSESRVASATTTGAYFASTYDADAEL